MQEIELTTIPTDLIRESKRGNPFSETDAVADIFSMADEKGEFYSTTRKLMNRWGWGSGKTVSFIKKLEEQNIIGTQTERKQNTLYRINTEFASISRNANGTQTERKRNSKHDEDIEIYKRIIDYLNMVCGTNYKPNNKQTKEHIHARLEDGFTEDDFYTVIDKKSGEWKGTKMEQYLRPQTLFNTKFESYLNQAIVKEQKKGNIDILDKWRNS